MLNNTDISILLCLMKSIGLTTTHKKEELYQADIIVKSLTYNHKDGIMKLLKQKR